MNCSSSSPAGCSVTLDEKVVENTNVVSYLDYPAIGDVDSRPGGVGHGDIEEVVVDDRFMAETVGSKCD